MNSLLFISKQLKLSHALIVFIRPSKTGHIMGSPVAASPILLSGAYLQNYTSYGYEISWVDRSHEGGVQCTGIITLACLTFELLPFVYFHTLILSRAYLQSYTSYRY